MKVLIVADTPYLAAPTSTYLSEWKHDVQTVAVSEFDNDSSSAYSLAPDSIILTPDMTIDTAQRLLTAFTPTLKSIVYCSSSKIYLAWGRYTKQHPGEPELIPLLEDDGLLEDSVFAEMEKRVKSSGIPSTILRLPDLFGPGRSSSIVTEYLQLMDSGVTTITLGPLRGAWRRASAFNQDIAYAIASATKNSKALNKVYNVADSFVFTQTDWINAIGRASGWTGSVVVTEQETENESIDYRQHLILDSSSIRQDLGYSEQVPINEALSKTVEWERSAGA